MKTLWMCHCLYNFNLMCQFYFYDHIYFLKFNILELARAGAFRLWRFGTLAPSAFKNIGTMEDYLAIAYNDLN